MELLHMNNAAFVGRLNPIHLGHEMVCQQMIEEFGSQNCIIFIGSCNTLPSLRHYFNYQERREFVKKIFPEVKIIGIPDYLNNEEWLLALDDLLLASNFDPAETIFFGGCDEDVAFFLNAGRKCKIINRFDGTTPKVSATEIRDCLIYDRPLTGKVNPIIEKELRTRFKEKWENFKRI